MALRYTDSGVVARTLLTYNQLPLFSQKQWRPLLFSQQALAGAPTETLTVSGE